MAVTLGTIKTKTRNILGDISLTGQDNYTYENSSIFTLSESNVITVSSVYVNGVELDTSDYSFDSSTNEITITASLTTGDTVTINYTYYSNFSDDEINAAIKSAIFYISVNNYSDWQVMSDDGIYPEPEIREQNLIAIISSLILEPDNKSYRLPDLSVIAPSDDPLPIKISKIIGTFKKNSTGIFEILNDT